MKRLADIFRGLATRTKPLDSESAFFFETKKVTEGQWDVTLFQGSEPYFRIASQLSPDATQLVEERAQLVCELMNVAPELTEDAARSVENHELAQELLDTGARLLLALDAARAIGSNAGYTSDANQRALFAVARAEDELRALILGNDGKAA